jgi:hypothetical protein
MKSKYFFKIFMKHRPFEQYFQQNPLELSGESHSPKLKEKVSKKEIDIFCRELLENNPELKEEILRQMENLKMQNLPMPVVHITLSTIKRGEEMVSTGFVENIKKNGFRKRDTNIGAFVERGKKTSIAKPDFFIEKPEEFIKSLRLFLRRYLHHGLRSNKQALGEFRDSKKAKPAMIFVEGDVKLEHGSDYDDHYILKEGATPEQILGIVNLNEDRSSEPKGDIAYVAKSLLELLDSRYGEQQKEVA